MSREWASCDCCDKYRPLSPVYLAGSWMPGGIWFICDECGLYGEREDDDIRYHTEMENK
jgi:hypothetical protein